jgi:regulator of PEP synthase PpsR (kinase-PPPase family)
MPDEIRKVPYPISNYVKLIKDKKEYPYYHLIRYLLLDMEFYYRKNGRTEVVYMINPRRLQEEIEEKIKSEKLTTVNILRTVLAVLYDSGLERDKDYYVTTSSRGRKNYHIKVNTKTLKAFRSFV